MIFFSRVKCCTPLSSNYLINFSTQFLADRTCETKLQKYDPWVTIARSNFIYYNKYSPNNKIRWTQHGILGSGLSKPNLHYTEATVTNSFPRKFIHSRSKIKERLQSLIDSNKVTLRPNITERNLWNWSSLGRMEPSV